MGILRADRITGLGGANAIKGSVFFGNNIDSTGGATGYNYLITERSDNFTFGTGDITIEGWFFCPHLSSDTNYQALVGDTFYYNYGGDSNNGFTFYIEDAQLNLWNDVSNSVVSGGTIPENKWTHLAWTRESGSNRIFVNGSLVGTASDSTNYNDTALIIGVNKVGQTSGSDAGQFPFSGFASNVRVLKGRALYTAAFTPPVGELQVIDNTVLLCCQSPGNVLQESTGVTLTAPRINNSAGAQASHFTPHSPTTFNPDITDQGTNFGSTYSGAFKFDSQSYMVLPGGITRDRYPKSTGDIVSDNLIFHLDGGDSKSYAGVSTSGSIIYDLKEGTNSTGVGIATMDTGHSDFERVNWVPDNRGCFRQSSDSNFGTITGNMITFPQISLGNDNYTINVWVKLNSRADGGDEIMHVVSNKDGGPVSFNAHLRMNSNYARIGAQAYYSSWTYRYSTTTEIKPGFWYMLTWVNTAQYTGKMYVNGELQTLDDGNTTWNSRTSNNTPLNATSYAGGETFDGWIGQIQFYSDTLSETEILQNYNAHKCRYVY